MDFISIILGFLVGLIIGGTVVNEIWYRKSLKDTTDWIDRYLKMNDDWANFCSEINKEWSEKFKELKESEVEDKCENN